MTWEDLGATYPLRIGGGNEVGCASLCESLPAAWPRNPQSPCRLWLYEVNSAEWKKWDCSSMSWNRVEAPPALSRNMKFAGIGTKAPPGHAVLAIQSLFREVGCGGSPNSAQTETASRFELGEWQATARPREVHPEQPAKQPVRRWRPKQAAHAQRQGQSVRPDT